jgi:hypothetical protein
MACDCNKKKVDEGYERVKKEAIEFTLTLKRDTFIFFSDGWWFVDEYSCIPSQAINVEYVCGLFFTTDT